MKRSSPQQAAGIAGAVLGFVYLVTLAPGITLWDAGEFASAVDSLGIPHPPGTPLFIVIARAWHVVLGFLPTANATNLLSAVCTAVAAAVAAALVTRWTRDTFSGIAAALTLGGMSTVWLNATETEVYSASLLMSVLTGNLWRYAWLFGLGIQCLWLIWIYAAQAYGFLPLCLALFVIYTRNHMKWRTA